MKTVDVRGFVERNLREVLPIEYGGEMLPEGPVYDMDALKVFWETVSDGLNRAFRRIGYGSPITRVFVDAEEGADAFVVFHDDNLSVSAVIDTPYPLEEDYEAVVAATVEAFEKMKDAIDRNAPLYAVRLPEERKCSGCGWRVEFFYFRAPSLEAAKSVIDGIKKGEDLTGLGCFCASCTADNQVVKVFEI